MATNDNHPLMQALLGELGIGAFLTPQEAAVAFHVIRDAAIELEDGARGFAFDGDTDTAETWLNRAMDLYSIAAKLNPDNLGLPRDITYP